MSKKAEKDPSPEKKKIFLEMIFTRNNMVEYWKSTLILTIHPIPRKKTFLQLKNR